LYSLLIKKGKNANSSKIIFSALKMIYRELEKVRVLSMSPRQRKRKFLVLLKILTSKFRKYEIIGRNKNMSRNREAGRGLINAENSSGSSCKPKTKLACALRFLAGASYLDLSFAFGIYYKTVMTYVWEAVEAIDELLDNIHFPIEDELKLRELEQGFLSICGGKFPGTVAAGDGVVFRMDKPNKEEVNGDVASFFTRKGFYG
jgi:hypothetical protein